MKITDGKFLLLLLSLLSGIITNAQIIEKEINIGKGESIKLNELNIEKIKILIFINEQIIGDNRSFFDALNKLNIDYNHFEINRFNIIPILGCGVKFKLKSNCEIKQDLNTEPFLVLLDSTCMQTKKSIKQLILEGLNKNQVEVFRNRVNAPSLYYSILDTGLLLKLIQFKEDTINYQEILKSKTDSLERLGLANNKISSELKLLKDSCTKINSNKVSTIRLGLLYGTNFGLPFLMVEQFNMKPSAQSYFLQSFEKGCKATNLGVNLKFTKTNGLYRTIGLNYFMNKTGIYSAKMGEFDTLFYNPLNKNPIAWSQLNCLNISFSMGKHWETKSNVSYNLDAGFWFGTILNSYSKADFAINKNGIQMVTNTSKYNSNFISGGFTSIPSIEFGLNPNFSIQIGAFIYVGINRFNTPKNYTLLDEKLNYVALEKATNYINVAGVNASVALSFKIN